MIPSDIAGLVRWFKGDSLALSDGDPVATWVDSSGHANAGSAGAARPTYKVAVLNGLPVVRFDGIANYLAFTALPSNFTAFSGFAIVRTTGDLVMLGAAAIVAPATWYPQMRIGDSGNSRLDLYDGGDRFSTALIVPRTSFSLVEFTTDGATISFYQNGTALGTSPGINAPYNFDEIASASNHGFFGAGGDIAEICIYSGVLSVADRQALEAYFAQRYFPVPLVIGSVAASDATVGSVALADAARETVTLADSTAGSVVPSSAPVT